MLLSDFLKTAKDGDVIDLKGASVGGNCGTGRKFATPVTITNGTVTDLAMVGFSNVILDSMEIVSVSGFYNNRIFNSDHITLTKCKVHDDGSQPIDQATTWDLYVRGSHHITIEKSDISGGATGIKFYGVDDGVIDANVIHGVRADFMQIDSGQRTRITRNEMHSGHSTATDHPDGVQLLNTLISVPADGVVVEDNIFYRGAGGASQGIFTQVKKSSFTNMSIRRNVVLGCLVNGIWPVGSGWCEDNLVLGYPDQRSGIRTSGWNGTLLNNQASYFYFGGKDYALDAVNKVAPNGNGLLVPLDPKQEAAEVAKWRGRVFPAMPDPAPAPSPPPPPPVDPLPELHAIRDRIDALITNLGG